MWRNWNTDTLLVETENGTIALEKNLAVSFKNRCVAFTRPSYPLPGACPKEMKTYIHTKTCTQRFTVASFMMSKSENNPSIHQLKNG